MKSTIGNFDSTPVDLTIPISLQNEGWQLSRQRHTQANQWQGYLNHLCLAVCLPWLSATFGRGVGSIDFDPFATGVRQWVAPSFWEIVDGSIVTIPQAGYTHDSPRERLSFDRASRAMLVQTGTERSLSLGDSSEVVGTAEPEATVRQRSRICLLPHTSCDRSELRVPREWMKIPNWVADYYWAVQIDLDARCATIWGSATHAQIQQHGKYDGLDRTYYIDADDLQFSSSAPTRGEVKPLTTLLLETADRYLIEWSHPKFAIPRLEIADDDFGDWLSLVAEDSWRLELFYRRLGLVSPLTVED